MTLASITALFPVQYLLCVERLETVVVVFSLAGTAQALSVGRLSLTQHIWRWIISRCFILIRVVSVGAFSIYSLGIAF